MWSRTHPSRKRVRPARRMGTRPILGESQDSRSLLNAIQFGSTCLPLLMLLATNLTRRLSAAAFRTRDILHVTEKLYV